MSAQSTAASQSAQSTHHPKNNLTWRSSSLSILQTPPTNVEAVRRICQNLVKAKAILTTIMCDLVVSQTGTCSCNKLDGMMNNFSGIGLHWVEFTAAQSMTLKNLEKAQQLLGATNGTTRSCSSTTNATNTTVVIRRIRSYLTRSSSCKWSARQVQLDINIAIHNHMLDESPKLLFMHWTVTGNLIKYCSKQRSKIVQTSSYTAVADPNAGTNATRPEPPALGTLIK